MNTSLAKLAGRVPAFPGLPKPVAEHVAASDQREAAQRDSDLGHLVPARALAVERLGASSAVALQSLMDGRHAALRQTLRGRLAQQGIPKFDLTREQARAHTLGRLHDYATLDVPLGFRNDEARDSGASVVAVEMLGFAELSTMVKAGVQWGLFGGAISALGTSRHHEEYLPRVRDLSLLGCFAMTETGHGSDVANVETTATYLPDTDEIEVHTPVPQARKDYIGNAGSDGRMAVVFAQLYVGGLNQGVHAVLVPIRDDVGAALPGVTLSDCGAKGGLAGVDNGRISFSHKRVPRTNLLNRYGDIDEHGVYSSPIENPKRRFFVMLGTLVRGRVSVAAAAGNATKSALTIATRYALLRKQFERDDGTEVSLLDYPSHQRRLLTRLATTYALHLAQERMNNKLHEVVDADDVPEDELRNLELWAAGMKAVTTDHANETIQECREACGGAGFMAENLITGLRGDCDVFATFEGDNTVLLQLVGKGLLTGYKHHVGELDSFGVARFMAEKLVSNLVERINAGAVVAGWEGVFDRDTSDSLLDRNWHVALFTDRAQHTLDGLARRLQASSRERKGFDAFAPTQVHLLDAARAEMDKLVLESCVQAIGTCQDDAAKALLNRVCDLYVLATVEANRAWYLEHGRLTPHRSKQVTAMVGRLCGVLAPHAATLVDAFAIPDNLVAAAMLHPVAAQSSSLGSGSSSSV